MTKIKRVELECVTCKSWIPFSIDLVGSNSADASKEVDRILRCPACSALAPFRHERMRLAGNDGKARVGWCLTPRPGHGLSVAETDRPSVTRTRGRHERARQGRSHNNAKGTTRLQP